MLSVHFRLAGNNGIVTAGIVTVGVVGFVCDLCVVKIGDLVVVAIASSRLSGSAAFPS